jgi:hypothetical protein
MRDAQHKQAGKQAGSSRCWYGVGLVCARLRRRFTIFAISWAGSRSIEDITTRAGLNCRRRFCIRVKIHNPMRGARAAA